jgi:addiction module RelE/StbE family toxin
MRVEWSSHAVADPKTISEYVEQDRNLSTANRVTRNIYEAVQDLVTMPSRGRQGRVEGTRELLIVPLPYIVVYQVFPERVLVLNVVHGAQRWP